ncbi:MAG: hypothetical protein HYX57_12240 [Chloroflexi bacterium]|nr:hypothetical protein [Chloroflexota bacterium]
MPPWDAGALVMAGAVGAGRRGAHPGRRPSAAASAMGAG